MRTLEISNKLTPANLFRRLRGMRFAYETKITNGVIEVVGRGATPEASHEEAQTQWEFAHLAPNTAIMFP